MINILWLVPVLASGMLVGAIVTLLVSGNKEVEEYDEEDPTADFYHY